MKHFVNFLKFCLFLGVGVSILYYLYYKMNISYQEQCVKDSIAPADCNLLEKIINDFKSVDIFWMAGVFLAFTISNISRMIRWGMLVRNLGYPVRNAYLFMSIIIGYLFNLFLPRLGEVVRAGVVNRTEHIPLEKVVGTIVVDRIMDVICLAIVVASAFMLEFDKITEFLSQQKGDTPEESGAVWPILLGLAAVGLLALFLIRKNHQRLLKIKFYQKIIGVLEGMAEGVRTIFKLKRPGLFILHSLNVWFMYFLMTYLCFFAFEPTAELSALIGWMVFAFAALGVLIPSPGGMGTVHFLTISALLIYGIDQFDALSFANILFFSIQIFYVVIGGIICLILLRILEYRAKRKKLSENEPA